MRETAVSTLDQLLDGSRVDRITAEARDIRFARVLLTVFAALFFGVGWILRKTFTVIWLAGAWSYVAAREGWREAGKTRVSRGHG